MHVEVQDSPQSEFAERMFVYYYRIRDCYQKPVISLAVLTDTRRHYRPNHYHTELAGCSLRIDFMTAKRVRDGRQRAANLMAFYRLAIEKNVKKNIFAN